MQVRIPIPVSISYDCKSPVKMIAEDNHNRALSILFWSFYRSNVITELNYMQ